MRTGIILHFLLLLSVTAYSQECGVEGARTKRIASPGVYYTLSHGYCYHYNSTTIETGYQNHYATVTFMTRNMLRATIRMKDEVYIGYTYLYKITPKMYTNSSFCINVGEAEPVLRFALDYQIYKPLYLQGSVIQVSDRMTHLIGGLKIKL